MATPSDTTFGDMLRQLRKASGLTQAELAERAGLSVRGLNDLERGARRTPRRDTVMLLGDALGLAGEWRVVFEATARRGGTVPAAPLPRGNVSAESQAQLGQGVALADLPADSPPRKSLDRLAHNLPIQPTPLLGREREIEDVCRLLRRDHVRLVTLTGPGGIGKTRLSLQVAAESLDAFADGACFVRLSRVTDSELVVPTIAQTLDLKNCGGTPLAEVVQGYLRDRQLLLVLDNFEQVAPAAAHIGELLTVCPRVKMLVTSRVALHLRGEHEYAVRPLALPTSQHMTSPELLSQYSAVALFIERAQAAQADFRITNANASVVAEICARLDGLPLAIELAASRVKLLPPPALLKRLERRLPLLVGGARDMDERQQTMRNTLAWSYDLLAPEERRLFHRLAVFVGGCTLEAAQAVCVAPDGAEPLAIDLLDGLGRLVDQSLVQQLVGDEEGGEPRFGMLQIIREFALEQLEASTEGREVEAFRQAHARFILRLSASSPVGMRDASDVWWLARLEREHDNLRAALGWALDRGEKWLCLRLGVDFAPFWWGRGYYGEGRRWLRRVLASEQASAAPDDMELRISPGDPDRNVSRSVLRAWTLWWLAKLAINQGDIESARTWADKCLEAARASGDLAIMALALAFAGYAELFPSPTETQRGEALLAEAVTLARRSNDPEVLVRVLGDKFNAHLDVDTMQDLDQAQALAEELLEAARHADWHIRLNVEAHVNATLAEVAQRQGDLSSARSYAAHALRYIREHGFVLWAASCLQVLAWVADQTGEGVRAARLLGASATEAERHGIIGFEAYPERETAQASTRAVLGAEAWTAAYTAGRALSLQEAIMEALGNGEF